MVIDGHQRIAALEQLRRDTVHALVWEMSEAEALLLAHSLRMNSEPETALEQGWLLAEMEEARLHDRRPGAAFRPQWDMGGAPSGAGGNSAGSGAAASPQGRIAAQIAMRYLAPVARVNAEQCVRMAHVFAQHPWTTRQAALLYKAWREAKSKQTRERILAEPELFLKTQEQQRQPTKAITLESDLNQIVAIARRALDRAEESTQNSEAMGSKIHHATRLLAQIAERIEAQRANHAEPIATSNDSGTARQGEEQTRDRETPEPVAPERTQGAASELHRRAEDRTRRESRAVPPTDPRVIARAKAISCESMRNSLPMARRCRIRR